MLRLVIADDEKVIRESLMECLNWQEIGIEVVACCANGLEALDAIMDESPDIVLTDIKMPGLSGLELIEKMQEIDREIEFIILSGFREFSFAKKAIDLGVSLYLLKPVSEEQILEAVKDAAKSCLEKKTVRATVEEHQQLRNQVEQYHRKQIQYAYFLQGNSLLRAVAYYEKQFPAHKNNNQILRFSDVSLTEATALTKRMHSYFEEEETVLITDFLFSKGLLLVVIHHKDSEAVQRLLEQMGQLGQVQHQLSPLDSVADCMQAISQESLRYFRTSAIDREGNVMEVYNTGLSLEGIQELLEELIDLANNDNRQRAKEKVEKYLGSIKELYSLRASCAHLLSGVLLHKHQINTNTREYQGTFDTIYQENEKEKIISLVEVVVLSLLWKGERTNDMIQTVKGYVTQRLADSNLSLKRIATEIIHVNVDYLSRLFVQETGEKFSRYLNRSRVEKAKKLFKQQDASKIYLVAEQVGLGHNPRYFSQVFRKYERMTPSAYVEQIRKAEGK